MAIKDVKHEPNPATFGGLRRRAEELLRKTRAEVAAVPTEDIQMLVHELQVYHTELELQNEELRTTQLELQDAKDQYLDLYEFAPVGYVTLDRDGKIRRANLTAATLLGVARGGLIGKRLARLIAPTDAKSVHLHCREVFATDAKQICEVQVPRADGASLHLLVESISFQDADGNRRHCRTAMIDITERKQAAAALDEARIFSEAIVETVREPLLILDDNLYVQSANQSFYQTFETTRQEIENRLVYELSDREWDIPPLRRLLEKVLPEHIQFNDFEVQHTFERIGQRTMLLNARALDREDDRPGLILLAIEDITVRKRADKELKRSAAKLQRHTRELERSNDELQDFAYVVSHDLRAPLVNLQGFGHELGLSCERLRSVLADVQVPEAEHRELSALLEEDIPEALEFITTNATKMDGLLSGVLQLSRMGQATLTIRPLDINQMVSEMVASRQFSIEQAGASVQVDSLPTCQGDEMQINQVFSNLLDNALKYLDPNRRGVILVCGQEDPDRVVYSIEDNGIGIAAQHQDSIYKVFHRLDPRRGTGEGLGLSIVRRILERHGGKIWLESEVNEGSKFYLSLPKG